MAVAKSVGRKYGLLVLVIIAASVIVVTIAIVPNLKQENCTRYDATFEICDIRPWHGMRFETDNVNIKFIMHNIKDNERDYLIIPSISSISDPNVLVEQPINFTLTIPPHGKEEWSYLGLVKPGSWRITVNMTLLSEEPPEIANKQTFDLPEEPVPGGIYVTEITSFFAEANSSSFTTPFLVQPVENYYNLMIATGTILGSSVTAVALGVQIVASLTSSKRLREQIGVQREELTLAKSRLMLETHSQAREREEARKRNLSEHCDKLIKNSNLEENYRLLPERFSSENIDLHRFKHLILEHLYTGHKELYTLTIEIPRLVDDAHSLNSLYYNKIRKAVRVIAEELGFPDESLRKETDPRFNELEVAQDIFHRSGTQNWKDIVYHFRGAPLNEYYLLQPNGSENTGYNASEEKVKQLVSKLNELAHDVELCKELNNYRKADEAITTARSSFEDWFKALFVSIESGTSILGGACRNCLSPEYHSEEDLLRFKKLLAEI